MDIPLSEILDAFFTQGGGTDCTNPLVRHQIESMNEFMDKQLIQIIQGFNPIQVCHNYNPDIGDFKYKLYINVLQPTLTKPMYQSTDGTQMLMTPHLARMNNLSYVSNLYVNVHVITDIINDDGITERKENTIQGVCIGKIPIMVRSKACVLSQMPGLADGHECRYDYGGYFIINGNEKVIISQDRISENKTLVFAPNSNNTGDGLYAEIRSMPDGMFLPPKTTSLHLSGKPNHIGNVIKLSASFIRSEIPLFVMFRALGIESDKEIYAHVVYDMDLPKNQRMVANLAACAEDACDIHTQNDALVYILHVMGSTGTPREYLDQPERAIKILQNIIHQDFLSHVGRSYKKKALYLGFMVRKILSIHLGYMHYDNRDSYLNKRIDTPGILFSNLFRQCYGKLVKEVRNLVVRELNLWRANPNMHNQVITHNNVHRFFKLTVIETGLRYALSTGNWGVKTIGSFQNIRQGVAQVLNRMSYLSTLSHMRRINTPMEKNGKLIQPRKLENSQFGMICPNETPEGAAVGLVKNIALSTNITVNTSSVYVREVLEELGTQLYGDHVSDTESILNFLKNMGSPDAVQVMINGDLLGFHCEPVTLFAKLKHHKRYGSIPSTTSIVWDVKGSIIMLSTEAGRMCRPLHIVDGGKIRVAAQTGEAKCVAGESLESKQFQRFVAPLHDDDTEGFLEYMDVDEIDKAMVAMFPRDLKRSIKGTSLPPLFTHCEIYPALMNGVLAANIPFMDHNQAPRNCYQCLWINEPVLMLDGSQKEIKDVKVGDEVLCFNPVTKLTENTRVVHQYIRPANKPMYRILTLSGRSIIATQDHKFSTNQGWQDVTSFNTETKLAIYSVPKAVSSTVSTPAVTIDVLDSLTADVKQVLSSYGLYPLYSNNPKLPVIARLAGFFKYRGSRGLPSNIIDSNHVISDITSLGFPSYNAYFISMMTALLSAIVPDNADIPISIPIPVSIPPNTLILFPIPLWVYDASTSKLVKREYMAGYFGGLASEFEENKFNEWLDILLVSTEYLYLFNIGYGQSSPYDNHITIKVDQPNVLSDQIKYGLAALGLYPFIFDWNSNPLFPVAYNNPGIQMIIYLVGYFRGSLSYNARKNQDLLSLLRANIFNPLFTGIIYLLMEYGYLSNDLSEGPAYYIINELVRVLADSLEQWFNPIHVSKYLRNLYLYGYGGALGLDYDVSLDPLFKVLTNAFYICTSALGITVVENDDLINVLGISYCHEKKLDTFIVSEYNRYIKYSKVDSIKFTVNDWVSVVERKGDMLLVPIGDIQHVRNDLVSDITVESDNHSFIGGDGFAVSNSAMGKQAVGIYATNFNTRIDTMAHVLHYPQKPLVRTRLAQYTNADSLPSGINAVVAIMTYSGFNQEDSVMINQSAVDRGLFTSSYYKSYRDMCTKNHSTGEEEIFTKPVIDADGRVKPYNYDKLGPDGFVPKDTFVDAHDICVGKVMPHKQHGVVTHRDTSSQLKGNDEGHIDKNYQSVNGDGYKFCKIRLRQYRKPVIGDKLASKCAQKGTIGMMYHQKDMPFSKSGITPDIIMNPHAIPSRMTIGQLMECIMGKAACHLGTYGDATPFTDCSVEGIASILERSGYERYGNEILYNGRTGQQIQTEIFIGPTYYQRLKHMVNDKMHSRGSSGPLVSLTRQPAEGRARNGGLRFGEMERDAIVAHGASAFLKERMIDVSDNYRVHICNKCGLICTANPERNIYKCNNCKNNADISQVRIPYAMKLLIQELMSMSVAPRIMV